ncbi:MAG: redoxin domain-containing protein [Verrucomicrobiota bacterium]
MLRNAFRFAPLLTLCLCIPIAASATETLLTDVSGQGVDPLNCSEHKAAVLVFMTTDCPVANSFAPELKRIADECREKNVKVTFVHVDPELADKDAALHAQEYGLFGAGTVLVDRNHLLVKKTGATITPEAAVFTPAGQLAYLGRVNNQYAGYGDRRARATEHDLRNAIEAVIAGRKVPSPRTEAIGCYIPDLD